MRKSLLLVLPLSLDTTDRASCERDAEHFGPGGAMNPRRPVGNLVVLDRRRSNKAPAISRFSAGLIPAKPEGSRRPKPPVGRVFYSARESHVITFEMERGFFRC